MALGIENLKKIVNLGAEALNVGSKIINGGGLLSALSLIDEVNALGTIEKGALLAELKDLTTDERLQLEELFKHKVSLQDKAVELKIEEGVDLLEKAGDLAIRVIGIVNEVKVLVAEAGALIKSER